MSEIDRQRVRSALEQSGCAWVLRMSEDGDAVLEGIAKELEVFRRAHKKHFPSEPAPDPFKLLQENLDRGAAFFETFTGPPLSVDFRISVWRILMGAQIETLQMQFDQHRAAFHLAMTTRFHNEMNPFPCEGTNIWDFQVVQRIGPGEISGRPFLGGFYRSGEPH